MVNEAEARKAVRQLMERCDTTGAQLLGMAYVLAKRDPDEYARLLEAADKAIAAVIQPIVDTDVQRMRVYAELDDPSANWCAALLDMLNNQGPITLTVDQALDQLKLWNEKQGI